VHIESGTGADGSGPMKVRGRLILSALASAFLLLPVLLPGGLASASTPSCPANVASDFDDLQWYPTNPATGIRAPISIVKNTSACSQTNSNEEGFDAIWVAISNSTHISQIGFIGTYDPSLGGVQYCRFWAHNTGAVQTYGACDPQENQTVYFKVHATNVSGTDEYAISDCGSDSSYSDSGCTAEGYSSNLYSDAIATAASETDYGKTACTVIEMGGVNNHVNFGTSTSTPLEEQATEGGSWGPKVMSQPSPICGADYEGNANTNGSGQDFKFGTWDARN
jgi:hypothetical protein